MIEEYLKTIGRSLDDLKGIFITHSHPDHIGAAAGIQRRSGCAVYAPAKEAEWIEDIDRQFSDRPIPNFYKLLPESVRISRQLEDGNVISPENGIELRAISTEGHSHGSMSYILNGELIFTGDAIPTSGDVPIFVDYNKSIKSLDLIKSIGGIKYACPAWDAVYDKDKLDERILIAKEMLARLKEAAIQVESEFGDVYDDENILRIFKAAGMPDYSGNRLARISIEACLMGQDDG